MQYLAWIVPWVVALGTRVTVAVYAACGLFLFAVYTFWSQGFPWYLADSNTVGDWRGGIIVLEVLAWLSIVAALLLSIASTARRRQSSEVPA